MFFPGIFASTKSPPYFIEEPSDTYVKKGRPAVLKCQVGGNPKPSIMWKRNGYKLDLTSDSRRMIKPDGSLYFSQIIHHKTQKPDEGTYECEAFSQISNLDYQIVSKTAHLIVAGKSMFLRLACNLHNLSVLWKNIKCYIIFIFRDQMYVLHRVLYVFYSHLPAFLKNVF